MCESSCYKVVDTEAPSAHSGGIAVFYRVEDHFFVEALQTYGANIVIFQMSSGDRQWYIVGCYLTLDNASSIEDISRPLKSGPRGARCWWSAISTPT